MNIMLQLRKQSGFSLLELLVVLVIIGLLMGVVGPKFFGATDDAALKATQDSLQNLDTALDAYRLSKGRYPTTEEGLEKLRDVAELPKEIKDAWNNPFVYELTKENGKEIPKLISLGADGQVGGEGKDADMTVK